MNCLDTGCPCVWANSPKVSGSIHPKSEQIGGFCFSVLTNWRKNFVNLEVKSALFRKILTGHIYEKIHWVKIAEMITHTQPRLDTFNAWSLIFLSGKSKIIGCVLSGSPGTCFLDVCLAKVTMTCSFYVITNTLILQYHFPPPFIKNLTSVEN